MTDEEIADHVSRIGFSFIYRSKDGKAMGTTFEKTEAGAANQQVAYAVSLKTIEFIRKQGRMKDD